MVCMAIHVMMSSRVVFGIARVKIARASTFRAQVETVRGALAKATKVKVVPTLTMEQLTVMDGPAAFILCPGVVPVMMMTSMLGPCAAHVVEGLNQGG